MGDSRFWRLIAVAGVAGLFYLAYGLQQSDSGFELPSMANKAQAGEVVTIMASPNNGYKSLIVTSNAAGDEVNIWSIRLENEQVNFVGSFQAISRTK